MSEDPCAWLVALAAEQCGVLTVEQLARQGLTEGQIRGLVRSGGWSSPARGVLVVPEPADPFRASLRAASLACPARIICRGSAARLHELQGLPLWTPAEPPALVLPPAMKRAQRRGMKLHWGAVPDDECDRRHGLRTTAVVRTLRDLRRLPRPTLVSLIDSALQQQRCTLWELQQVAPLAAALAVADGRAESPLETRVRLVLVAAGLAPEDLQHVLRTTDGRFVARLDLAWPSRRVAVEADGRGVHAEPAALYRDRARQNDIVLLGWTVLRFTWDDVLHRPTMLADRVRAALRG